MTQEQLAKKLDKTYITVGDYERGKVIPPLPVVLELCEVFDVNIDTLVNRDLTEKSASSELSPTDYRAQYEALKKQYQTLERLNKLQDQRLADLEWMIRKHAPELAREIGLEE